ncbi:MAG: hypothetical protein HYX24_06210 [Candidatus Aenigmarchaeota archaeon]|nr:hypothetical protein [Candidatus Aenigmarchaeota archaeon]
MTLIEPTAAGILSDILYIYVNLILPLLFVFMVFRTLDKKRNIFLRLAISSAAFIIMVAFMSSIPHFFPSSAWSSLWIPSLAIASLFYATFKEKNKAGKRLTLSIGVFVALIAVGLVISELLGEEVFRGLGDSLIIPEGPAVCQYGIIEAFASTTDETLNADSIVLKELRDSEGNPVKGFDVLPDAFPLRRGEPAKKIISFNCGGTCTGTYTMILVKNIKRITRTVTCE